MNLNCYILDDEPLASELIKGYLETLTNFKIIGISNSPSQAIYDLQQNPVDILFLDIEMPRLKGFDVLRPLSYKPKVVFTTAYTEFALESYEFDVIDFLIKPISFERFLKTIGKIYRFAPPLTLASPAVDEQKIEHEYQYFKVGKEMLKIYLNDIFWIESIKDYVKVCTNKGVYISYLRMNYLEEKLPISNFIRIHKSYIINLNHIEALGNNYVRINNFEIPIGRMYKPKAEEYLKLV